LGLLTIDHPDIGLGVGVGDGVGVGVGVGEGFGRAWDATAPVGTDARIVRTATTTIKGPTRQALIGLASLSGQIDTITIRLQAQGRGKAS